ncbi:MAG: hypothetical protein DRI61_09450 [Chloroflexi bacterium]|nr:MAG: hypothetical protein DRI61_09450 [Chloroflexota bacterium]
MSTEDLFSCVGSGDVNTYTRRVRIVNPGQARPVDVLPAVADAVLGVIYHQESDDGLYFTEDNVSWINLSTGGGAGSDTTAIHDNVAGEIIAITEKTAMTAITAREDEIVIEDSNDSNDKKSLKLKNIPENGLIWGEAKSADYTILQDDYAVGVDTSGGDVIITLPTASGFSVYPKRWLIKKMSNDNRLIIVLQTPSDSMYYTEYPDFDRMALNKIGEGVEIILNANQKYTFASWAGIQTDVAYQPSISTETPALSGTTLTMNANLDDMGAFTTLYSYFRYRNVTDGGAWVETTPASESAVGSVVDTATVTAAKVYEVQSVISVGNDIDPATSAKYYGSVLRNSSNYYANLGEAIADGLVFYTPLQEDGGDDIAGEELVAANDIVFAGGVTIGSDTINSETIYKRIFGANDWGESPFAPDITADFTALIQVDMNSNTGDHTILNFGESNLSLASDGSNIQLEVNTSRHNWTSATPFSGILNLFLVVDTSAGRTYLYECDDTTRTQRATRPQVPSSVAQYIRIARGTAGDANHQDDEYMDDGEIRSIGCWSRILSEATMKNICDALDNDGVLLLGSADDTGDTTPNTGQNRFDSDSATLVADTENKNINSVSYATGHLDAYLWMRKNAVGTDGGDSQEDVVIKFYGNKSVETDTGLSTVLLGTNNFVETNVDGAVSASSSITLDTTAGLSVDDILHFNDATNGKQYAIIASVDSGTAITVEDVITLADNANACKVIKVCEDYHNMFSIGLECANAIDAIYAQYNQSS